MPYFKELLANSFVKLYVNENTYKIGEILGLIKGEETYIMRASEIDAKKRIMQDIETK